MELTNLMNEIKEKEINLYREMINAVTEAYNKADKNILKNEPWKFWSNVDENICADYDVREMFRKEVLREKNYTNIEKDIEEHITKLQKSITKVIGEFNYLEQIDDTNYLIYGTKANCTIKVTFPKLSSTKNVMKARIKIIDITENKQPKEEKNSNYEDSIYVKQWKEKELQGYISAKDRYVKELDRLHEIEDNIKQEYEEVKNEYRNTHNGELPKIEKGHYLDAELDIQYQKKEKAHNDYWKFRHSNMFFNDYAWNIDFEDICKKEIDKHFNQLQDKVEKKIGRIIKIENLGGDDYAFIGEKDRCVVEVIWAGGYNIQRLHTRWIVKNWNLED